MRELLCVLALLACAGQAKEVKVSSQSDLSGISLPAETESIQAIAGLLLALSSDSIAFSPSGITKHISMGRVADQSRVDHGVLQMTDGSPHLDRRSLMRLVASLPLASSLAAHAADLGDLSVADAKGSVLKASQGGSFELGEVGEKPKKKKGKLTLDEKIAQLQAKKDKTQREKDKLADLLIEQECELTGRKCGSMQLDMKGD